MKWLYYRLVALSFKTAWLTVSLAISTLAFYFMIGFTGASFSNEATIAIIFLTAIGGEFVAERLVRIFYDGDDK